MKYALNLKYVYSFYSFGEILSEGIFEQQIETENSPIRFTLRDQEDGSFILSELKEDFLGKYVTLTFPNKDIIMIYENKSSELEYDEYFSAMGDDNHNVYVGAITLQAI